MGLCKARVIFKGQARKGSKPLNQLIQVSAPECSLLVNSLQDVLLDCPCSVGMLFCREECAQCVPEFHVMAFLFICLKKSSEPSIPFLIKGSIRIVAPVLS